MRITQPDRQLLREFVATHAPACTGDVLDVGGGGGRYRGLFSRAKSYTILDPNAATHPDIVGTAEAIPLDDASVDTVLCTQVMGDVWDVQKAVNEIARVLKPGGTLMLTESMQNELHDEPNDFWRITPESWKKLLAEHFEILMLETRGGFFSMKTQHAIRRRIEKYDLYNRPLLGNMMSVVSPWLTHLARLRDRNDTPAVRRKFAIGFNVVARRK